VHDSFCGYLVDKGLSVQGRRQNPGAIYVQADGSAKRAGEDSQGF
jgi:hypothetical protein